ncbi:glycosyltransferase (activator-dependent family) [Saccharothrix tamanrassetensis]|uniref:Glycosyltransferase (Activator-dependent family) n=1 Tax=Saccharothrix tamanrassetensis TaxID=1051531 RepID=A0A841CNP1_9PSEU|nr:activator-dependent family glycosyltransferase [Saccharothrix tamanrassetensis]MBB5958533.1 glycosyltransferase (activator-dependent family) [Saccharothrix tamanrassetensis]
MRVLFAVNPEKSLFPYLVPLAWALRTAGHEVRVASRPGFADVITRAGLTAVPVGRDQAHDRRLVAGGMTPEAMQEARSGMGPPYDVLEDPSKADWEYLRDEHLEAVRVWHRPENFPLIAGLVEFARAWEPDLVVWEPTTYAGPIAAKACGAAHARFLWSVDAFGLTRDLFLKLKAEQPAGEQVDPLADWFSSYGRKYGFEFSEDMTTGHFTVDQIPPSLRDPADLHYVPMRYVPYGGAAVVPPWLWAAPEKPRVALTMGLSATRVFGGYDVPLQEILDELGDLDIELVATIAESEQRKLTRVPANTRVVSYAPLHALAPTCSVVIHHAGAATLTTTALYAVPQLSLHHHWDGPMLARGLAAQGAGLEIHTTRVTGRAVREAVLRLLHEPGFRDRAADLRDELRQLPTPNQLVPEIELLTAKYRAVTP